MTRKSKLRAAGISILFLLTAYIIVGISFQTPAVDESEMMNFYFFNPSANELVAEKRFVPEGSYKEISQYLWGVLSLGPESSGLSKIFPEGFNESAVEELAVQVPTIEETSIRNIEIRFNEKYYDLTPAQEIILRSAVVWTFTELDWVNEVVFRVGGVELARLDGRKVGSMTRENVLISPDEITQKNVNSKVVTLYFANEELTGLIEEKRVIQFPSDVAEEKVVLQELMKGPSSKGLVSLIPTETVINDVRTEASTCTVDLNSRFDTRLIQGTAERKLAIYSIVNTLTEHRGGNIKKVQFLINSEVVASKNYEMDLNRAFEKDETLIISSKAHDTEEY